VQRIHRGWTKEQVMVEVQRRCEVYDVPKITAFDLMRREFKAFVEARADAE